MKAKYETPTAEKLEFNYSEMVAASNISKTNKSEKSCGSDGKTKGPKEGCPGTAPGPGPGPGPGPKSKGPKEGCPDA